MVKLNKKDENYFKKLAEDHVDFLAEKIFKPAFIMGFIHGAKHGAENE